MSATPNVNVIHSPETRRFLIEIGGGMDVPQLLYDIVGTNIRMNAVRVPPDYRNQGYASELTRTALEFAKKEQLRVVPVCPFVQWYLREHPEYQELTQPET